MERPIHVLDRSHASERMTMQALAAGLLTDCPILVTGAGTGIGRAVSLRLLDLGAVVLGLGRRLELLEETARLSGPARSRMTIASCDVRDTEHAAQVLAEFADSHGLHGLVNNAGGQFYARATDISQNGWRAVIDLNLNAVFALTQAAYPYLRANGGCVVNMSLSGVERGGMGLAHSIAARAGVLGLTRSLALEWAADNIRLNCIGPGTVFTDGMDSTARAKFEEGVTTTTPLGRATEPEEVAELIGYLMSPAAAMLSGQLLQIDGAAHLGPGLHADMSS